LNTHITVLVVELVTRFGVMRRVQYIERFRFGLVLGKILKKRIDW